MDKCEVAKKNPQVSNPEEEDKDSSDTESESEHDSVTSEKNDTEKWIKKFLKCSKHRKRKS